MASGAALLFYDFTPVFRFELADVGRRRRFWDETQLVAALQGLANRDEPRLFVRYLAEPDDFWWARMTEPGGWLAGREVRRVESLRELLADLHDSYKGAVVWDERVPATSNLASTIAGADRLLPLRFDDAPGSLYRELTSGDGALVVKQRLLSDDGSPLFTGAVTGSAKCDAYRWLIDNYVRTGRANPRVQGYYLDAWWLKCWQASQSYNCTLMNHDYVIAHGGLFWDLHVWDDEAPIDDPTQPPGTDLATLKELLHASAERVGDGGMMHVAGFTPWAYKYTDFKSGAHSAAGRHGAVATEWRTTEILSCFNAWLDADALAYSAMANASFFQHRPLPPRVPQAAPSITVEALREKGILDAQGRIVPRTYYAHYVGDYDSAAWLYWQLPLSWNDPARGALPLSWAFNPTLEERFPVGMLWARQHATPNDVFVTGDSGAGYVNPGHFTEPREFSGLPSGWSAWERHSAPYHARWDLNVVGFVIDGHAPPMDEEGWNVYARLAPGGVVLQRSEGADHGVRAGIPFTTMAGDLPHEPAAAARMIASRLRADGPHFLAFRSILKTPAWYVEVQDELKKIGGGTLPADAQLVDLRTLLWLIHEHEKQLASGDQDEVPESSPAEAMQ